MTADKPTTQEWLPLDEAAKRFGYMHPESFRERIRRLRKRGLVIDIGRPPANYEVGEGSGEGKIMLMWANPTTALIRSDVPRDLLNPKRGRPTKKDTE